MTHTANNELTTGPGARFTVGELVDVTIRGARIFDIIGQTTMRIEVAGDWVPTIVTDVPGVTVTRVAPAEWPPQPGDIWHDRFGAAWYSIGGAGRLIDNAGGGWTDVDEVLDAVGPMRLEYRPGWTPAPSPVVTGAEPAADDDDPRAGWISGLRELADLLERNPALPFNPHDILVGGRKYGPEGVRQWAYALGVDVQSLSASDGIHWTATGVIGGATIRCYWIDETGAGLDQPEAAKSTVVPFIGGGWIDEATGKLVDEPTQQLPIVAPGTEFAGDDDGDGRCSGYAVVSVMGQTGSHRCELYGDDHTGTHVCACGYTWANQPDDQPVPAPREAAE